MMPAISGKSSQSGAAQSQHQHVTNKRNIGLREPLERDNETGRDNRDGLGRDASGRDMGRDMNKGGNLIISDRKENAQNYGYGRDQPGQGKGMPMRSGGGSSAGGNKGNYMQGQ